MSNFHLTAMDCMGVPWRTSATRPDTLDPASLT